jgi:hypothetical protein
MRDMPVHPGVVAQKTFPDPATETPRASPAIVYNESSPAVTLRGSAAKT